MVRCRICGREGTLPGGKLRVFPLRGARRAVCTGHRRTVRRDPLIEAVGVC